MPAQILLCEVGSISCGLRITDVAETMRPLPVDPLSDMPPFLLGLSCIRGKPVPVIDLAALLGAPTQVEKNRFVVIKIGDRHVAVAVTSVVGVRVLDRGALKSLPPLLAGARAELVSAIASLDAQLLVILDAGHLLSDSVRSAEPSDGDQP